MNRALRLILTFVASVILLVACKRVPDYVIQPDDMAELIADIHIGEAYVESNYGNFYTDSTRMLMKQSVIYKHGYTLEQVDTSFMWYGSHLDIYQDVYDKAISIIESRIAENRSSVKTQMTMEAGGDSTNVWHGAERYTLSRLSPSRYITFDIPIDKDRHRGDMYTLRASFTNAPANSLWIIQAAYDDGSIEILQSRFSGDGRHELTFYTDSLKMPTRLYGSMEFDMHTTANTAFIDSVKMIRKGLIPRLYPQRYRQRSVDYFKQ